MRTRAGEFDRLAAQAHRQTDISDGGDDNRGKCHHPDRNDEALRLVGSDHAFPVRRQRRVLGVGIAQEARGCHTHGIERAVAGAAGHPVLAAEAERQAVILKLKHLAVAVGMALQLVKAGEKLGAGIDVATQHDHQRLARPGAGAAPRRVQREVVEQRRHGPGRLVGALQRGARCHGGVARLNQLVE
ncbi:hypothetical protein ACVILI_005442 [Mesorhizobium sp. USDA 4775]